MLQKIKGMIALDNPFRLLYHKLRAIIANIRYAFPHTDMVIIWVTGTNGKTTTCNIIAKALQESWVKVFMFSTVNIIIGNEEYQNNTKMTSPDVFQLQKLLKQAKEKWCTHAVIETASHGIKMHRIWWIQYDICVLTNITQDHLDLHRTMKDYVNTKLEIFQKLITYKRKKGIKKTAIINKNSDYADLFLSETYDTLFTYGTYWNVTLSAYDIVLSEWKTRFKIKTAGSDIKISTPLIGDFNIQNILAATGVLMSLWFNEDIISSAISKCRGVPGRLEWVENNDNLHIFVDYAHTPDALEKVLLNLRPLVKEGNKLVTVFWATWDRDKTKRPIMWEIVSRLSDVVILTQDDDYSEKTEAIIKDVLPWIERKEGEDFWIISTRREAIQSALLQANPGDVILIAGKWDEHIMVTNHGNISWHDKTVILEILDGIDKNKIIK